jgi:hypothetical protein
VSPALPSSQRAAVTDVEVICAPAADATELLMAASGMASS